MLFSGSFWWRCLLAGILLHVGRPPLAAQQLLAPRDTSFTVHSALAKARKQDPSISLAAPPVPGSIRSARDIAYCTIGSRTLRLDVFEPKARRRQGYPAVLFVHGGGWRSGDRSQHVPMAQQLAAHGFVTITAEYRLSTEALYPAAVLDLKAALRWLRANARTYQIDSTRVAIWGFSAGGQLATLVGTTNGDPQFEGVKGCCSTHSSSVQAIVDVDGTLAFIHPESGEGDDSKGKSAATYWFGASKTEKPELWYQAGALNHVSAHTPPLLFINSSVARMHAGRDDLIKELDRFHIYHEEHAFSTAPHPFPLFNPWFEPTLNYTADFLNKVFPPNKQR